jgi:antimicrobial peptide system SdpA family protein
MSLSDTLDFNTLNFSIKLDKKLFNILPQGWAFFTRSPREGQVFLLKKKGDAFFVENLYHSKINNVFGLNRVTTKINYELMSIYSQFKKTDFVDGQSNMQCNITDSIPKKIHYVRNKFRNAKITGEYVLIIQKLVPYAWISKLNLQTMPCKSIRFYAL